MTRSALSPHSPEAAKKIFRANAKAQGVTFAAAARARTLLPKQKDPVAPGMGRRTHGKIESSYWNGRAFVEVGDEEPFDALFGDVCQCEGCARWDLKVVPHVPCVPVLNSLLDIAKPAKAKGVAKEFEVVESVTRVMTFDDEEWCGYEDRDEEWEEWEEAYEEGTQSSEKEKKASYSEIVEGRGSAAV